MMLSRSLVILFLATAALSLADARNTDAAQQPITSVLLSDDFSNGLGNWTVGTNTVGNTQYGLTPTVVSNATGAVSQYAKMQLSTFNATTGQAGVTTAGSQINTNATYALPTSGGTTTGQGIRFQVTSRIEATGLTAFGAAVTTPAGLIGASFSYGFVSGKNGYLNEIDYENLTAQQSPATTANSTGTTGHTNQYFGISNGDATLATSYATTAKGTVDNTRNRRTRRATPAQPRRPRTFTNGTPTRSTGSLRRSTGTLTANSSAKNHRAKHRPPIRRPTSPQKRWRCT